jgi:hypothetical protein
MATVNFYILSPSQHFSPGGQGQKQSVIVSSCVIAEQFFLASNTYEPAIGRPVSNAG